MGDIAAKYESLYGESPVFRQLYLDGRNRLYRQIVNSVFKRRRVRAFIDIGTSYGLIIKFAQAYNIAGYGIELPIENLINIHKEIGIGSRVFYGNVEDLEFCAQVTTACSKVDCVVCLDTLRHLQSLNGLMKLVDGLDADLLVFKEVTDNWLIRRKRRSQFDVKLYSPRDVLGLFQSHGFRVEEIFASRFAFCLHNPSRFELSLINSCLPTYTIVLRKR